MAHKTIALTTELRELHAIRSALLSLTSSEEQIMINLLMDFMGHMV